jgi:sugar lactone lactonase YvrE
MKQIRALSRTTTILLAGTAVFFVAGRAGAQNLLNNPESVVYDAPRDRYLVSNWGNGAIVEIDNSGAQDIFSGALLNQYKLAGLYIMGDTLLAAAGDAPDAGVAGFDLETGVLLYHIVIPDVGLPNDITSDSDGIVYVTDYWGDKLYKIEDHSPRLYFDEGLDYPNGMVYDDRYNRLLIASVMGTGSPILAVSLDDSSISTVVTTGLYATDGLTLDADYRVYISEVTNDRVYRYDSDFSGPPTVFSSGHDDPADIYYDFVNDVLAVPNLSGNSVDFVPVYSKDGGGTGRIAYCYQPVSGPAVHEIYTIKLDGTENEKISDAPIGVNHHDWSRDGQRLALVGYPNPPDTWSIYVMNADGGGMQRLTATSDVWDDEPSWSPDDTRIAFGRLYPNEGFREEIWMMNADGSDQHWIGVYGDNPTWSPDGTRLAYHSGRSGNYDIYTCNPDGTMEQQVTSTASYNEIGPDWSPDGARLAYQTDRDGNREIYVMNTDGSNTVRLTNNDVDDFMPVWSPDGSLIIFGSGLPGDDHWEVYVMRADGRNLKRVTYTPSTATAINPDWQPFNSATAPVFLSEFHCEHDGDRVTIRWSVTDAAAASDFRLDAVERGQLRSVPVSPVGPRKFVAVDRRPGAGAGRLVTYRLYFLEEDGKWRLLRTRSVELTERFEDCRLLDVHPNPFNPYTTVSFSIAFQHDVRIEIHDAAGRRIATLVSGEYPAGEFHVSWDGRDWAGEEAASGVYFLTFKAGKMSQSRKLVLVR